MPKIKTRRAAAKRFRKTVNGKIMRRKAFHRHILTKKSSKRKRALSSPGSINANDVARIRKMLPY